MTQGGTKRKRKPIATEDEKAQGGSQKFGYGGERTECV
jgi:hypothetical protein